MPDQCDVTTALAVFLAGALAFLIGFLGWLFVLAAWHSRSTDRHNFS